MHLVTSPTPAERPSFPRAFYGALAAILMFALGLTLLVPVLPLFVTDKLGAAESWIGTATLVIAWSSVVSRIPAGMLADRSGRRRVMLIGAVLGVAAGVLYLLSHSIAVFMVARFFSGISLGLFTTANKAMIADLAPPARRGEALGLGNTAFSFAMVLSPLLSEGLKNAVGFEAVFALSSLLMAGAFAVSCTLPDTRIITDEGYHLRRDMRDTLRERGTWAATLLIGAMGVIMMTMFTFYPLLAERKGLFDDAPRLLSAVAMGLGISIWAIIDSVIEPIAGRLSDRLGRQQVAIPGLIVALIGLAALSQAQTTGETYLAIAVMATGWGTARVIAETLSQDAVPPVLRGTAVALLALNFDLVIGVSAQVLSTQIDGADFSGYFAAAFALVLIMGIPGIILSTRVIAHERRGPVQTVPPIIGD